MAKYRCKICKREFSSSSGLTRHCNAIHGERRTFSLDIQRNCHQQLQTIPMPEHDAKLWNTPITMPVSELESTSTRMVKNPGSKPVDNDKMEDVVLKKLN